MVKLSKRMRKGNKSISKDKSYSLEEAVGILQGFPKANFDETVELHFSLNINPKSPDQMMRGTVSLPNGTGKSVKIAVFCKGELETKAKEAGADFVGSQDLVDKVSKGFLDFDVVISSPDMMRDLSKLGRILGPRGLMPTPKAGTVTTDVVRAIQEIKKGKIEFRSDKQGGLHLGVGKITFSKEKILQNIEYVIEAINQAKPIAVKGSLVKSLFLSTTMGPGLRLVL